MGENVEKENGMKNIIALSSVPLVMTLGNSMLIPVLPMMEKKLSVTSFQVSLIITVYSVVAIICIPIAGYLSDRFEEKNIASMSPHCRIRWSGSCFCLNLHEKSLCYDLGGACSSRHRFCGCRSIVMPFIGDLFEGDDEKVSAGLGDIETANTSGKVLSPILGALLASYTGLYRFGLFRFSV